MTLAENIREFVKLNYIDPARQNGHQTVTFRASTIHKVMGLQKRFPAVCGAIDTNIFLEYASVVLLKRTGPHQGPRALWTFELLEVNKFKPDR